MNARQQIINAQKRELQNAGYRIAKNSGIRCNSGSESWEHFLTKCIAGKVLSNQGYRVDSEVPVESPTGTGYIDLLAFGHQTRRPIVVEVETDPDGGIWERKWNIYGSDHIRDLYILEANSLDVKVIRDTINKELGL